MPSQQIWQCWSFGCWPKWTSCAEVAGLRRENLELRQQAGYWRSRHADAVRRMAALEQENEQLRGEIRKLQAERFGRRSEKQSAQRSLE